MDIQAKINKYIPFPTSREGRTVTRQTHCPRMILARGRPFECSHLLTAVRVTTANASFRFKLPQSHIQMMQN